MIRRFNYTGRVKIPQNRIDVSLLQDNAGKYFKAKINLDGLNFPPHAKVIIEPNYKGIYQRFYFGTVDNIQQPHSTRLDELPDTEMAYFDVSVVDEQGEIGLLLGKAKGIIVGTKGSPNDRLPLLYVNPVDLKDQFWKLSFDSSDDGRPILEINNKIPGFSELLKSKDFICFVYPVAFRLVLHRILEEDDFDVESDSWIAQWIKFLNIVLGIKSLPELEGDEGHTPEKEAWVDDCVNEYCKKFKLFEKFILQ